MHKVDKTLQLILGSSPDVKLENLCVDNIVSNPSQPRKTFDEAKLKELASSIRTNGILQPIIVHRADGHYELIAGERRLRAAKMAGLTHIPALIRQAADSAMKTLALVENLHRADLTTLEKAASIGALKSDLGATSLVAAAIGLVERSVERYVRIDGAISSIPDLVPILQNQHQTIDFATATAFADISQQIRGLRETDRQEYDHALALISEKGLKSVIPSLTMKFGTGKKVAKGVPKQHPPVTLAETATELILTLRFGKQSSVPCDAAAFKSAFTEFINKIAIMQVGGDETAESKATDQAGTTGEN